MVPSAVKRESATSGHEPFQTMGALAAFDRICKRSQGLGPALSMNSCHRHLSFGPTPKRGNSASRRQKTPRLDRKRNRLVFWYLRYEKAAGARSNLQRPAVRLPALLPPALRSHGTRGGSCGRACRVSAGDSARIPPLAGSQLRFPFRNDAPRLLRLPAWSLSVPLGSERDPSGAADPCAHRVDLVPRKHSPSTSGTCYPIPSSRLGRDPSRDFRAF